jgi:hypothetical protein
MASSTAISAEIVFFIIICPLKKIITLSILAFQESRWKGYKILPYKPGPAQQQNGKNLIQRLSGRYKAIATGSTL